MATITNKDGVSIVTTHTGRRMIYTDEVQITDANICSVVENAYTTHLANRSDIVYLYKYFKGEQPVLYKTKDVRPEINNKIVINLANEIVTFKVGYLVGKPIQYISSVPEQRISQNIATLNDMMRNEGKVTKDRKLVEWQMICGTGYRLVLPKKRAGEKVPWEMYTLNPMNAFVVYSNDYKEEPMLGVSYKKDANGDVTFTAYTEDKVYTIGEFNRPFTAEKNPLGRIPIIEYPANTARLGAFEVVEEILDAINDLDSDRLDSVKQFVESLLVVYNADFDEDVTANTIRQAGMVILRNLGENKADIKVLSEKLDQANTESLKQSLIKSVHDIVGMPMQGNGSTADSSNNGAVILKNGWQGAETRAEDFEAMFYEPEKAFLRIVSEIAESQGTLEFDPDDIDIRFTRRNYEDILAKSQTLVTLLNSPFVAPHQAYLASGLFSDVEDAVQQGILWEMEKKKYLVSTGPVEGETTEAKFTGDEPSDEDIKE